MGPHHLFTINERGIAQCLDAPTGEVLGRTRIGGKHSASPVFAQGRIHFLSEECKTTVVEATPEMLEVARNALPGICQASLAISSGRILLRSDTRLYALETR